MNMRTLHSGLLALIGLIKPIVSCEGSHEGFSDTGNESFPGAGSWFNGEQEGGNVLLCDLRVAALRGSERSQMHLRVLEGFANCNDVSVCGNRRNCHRGGDRPRRPTHFFLMLIVIAPPAVSGS